jgi:Ca2+-binding RTX toxin-like protein
LLEAFVTKNPAARSALIESLDRRILFVDVSASFGYVGRTFRAGQEITGAFTLTTHSKHGLPRGEALGVSVRLSTDRVYGNGDDILLLALNHFGGTQAFSSTNFIEDPDNDGELIEAENADDPRLRLTIPATTPAGNYYVVVKADDTDQFDEDNEKNNLSFSATPNVKVLDVDGVLRINGTDRGDSITVSGSAAQIDVSINGARTSYDAFAVAGIEISGGDGNDIVALLANTPATYVNGGAGNDKISGGPGADTLTGGTGADQIYGGRGDDRLNGGAGRDRMYGEGGNDRLFGNGGNDLVDGGSGDDRLNGNAGDDSMFGQSGNDTFDGGSGTDEMTGGSGSDSTSTSETDDILSSIENAFGDGGGAL